MVLIGLPLALAASPPAPLPPTLAKAVDPTRPAEAAPPPSPPVQARVTIRRVIIRVPTLPHRPVSAAPTPALPPIVWVEQKAAQCVPMRALSAASIARADAIDLVLAGGKRLRARLGDECSSMAFYSAFYLKGTDDGMLCAQRDSVRTRSGSECRIARFTRLVPGR